MDDDREYTTISEKKDVLLEKNNLGEYKLNIIIHPTSDSGSIFELTKKKVLFDLIYELNKELIKKYEKTVDSHVDNISFIFIDVINEDNILDEHEEININLKLKTNNVSDNICEIVGLTIENSSSRNKEIASINKFVLKIEQFEDSTIGLNIFFSFLEMDTPDFIKNFIALYFQKIFYKLKLYFE